MLKGFFTCSRGFRQGDPLSSILFCLVEEVLSRKLYLLVASKKIDTIKGPKNISVSSHILYAEDVLIFCKRKIFNIKSIISTFEEYAVVSGQCVNSNKSNIFGGAMSTSRWNILSALVGFKIGYLLFVYLGVPLFKGKPKSVFLRLIADKVINKLASWKGSLLSIAGRVELIKSAIQSMLLHSMAIYVSSISLVRDIERMIKRFIWSGEVSKSKVIIVAWNNMCLPLEEGGLGIRSIIKLNEAFKLKLA